MPAFIQDPGAAGGTTGGGGGGPRNGSGSGGTGPYVNPGSARDLSLKLDPVTQKLILTLTPNDSVLSVAGVTYWIWWLDPKKFSQNDIYGQAQLSSTLGWSFNAGRVGVATLPSGVGPVSTTVDYLTAPWNAGGWMYATVINSSGTEYNLVGTNFVSVPSLYLTSGGAPAVAEKPYSVYVIYSNIGTNQRRVSFGWTNGPSLNTVSYVQILVNNYWNDGFWREVAVYSATGAGQRQGLPYLFSGNVPDSSYSVVLEPDSSAGVHNVNWYFVPLTKAGVPLAIGNCNSFTTGNIS